MSTPQHSPETAAKTVVRPGKKTIQPRKVSARKIG
jgi:hypothetical protein